MAVYFDKQHEKYGVRVQVNKRRYWGGYHETLEKAERANRKLLESHFPLVAVKEPLITKENNLWGASQPLVLEDFKLGLEETVKTPFKLRTPTRVMVLVAKIKLFFFEKMYEKELDEAIAKSKV